MAPFARRHLWYIYARSVLGHSAWLLASLVDTYGVFVPRSVLGHSAWLLAPLVGTNEVFVPRSVLGHSA